MTENTSTRSTSFISRQPVNQMYVCIQAYLDGKGNCDEVMRVMRQSTIPSAKLAGIVRQLSDFGDKAKYSLLRRECRSFGLF